MTDKEISEIRRRFKTDKSNITSVRGCYVNEKHEIASEFNYSLALIPQAEAEEILAVLRRTLSGKADRNLRGIVFSNNQVLEGEEHAVLTKLRKSQLADEEALKALYEKIISSYKAEGSYLILLASDKYDVPSFSKNDEINDDSGDVFSYILCSVCPVKVTKAALGYYLYENKFKTVMGNNIISAPEVGFMFPAFDDRKANIYNALYYTHGIKDSHEDFSKAVFGCEPPVPAATQKERFDGILSGSVGEQCDIEVVKAMHEHMREMVETHAESDDKEPLTVTRETLGQVLSECGVDEEKIEKCGEMYEEEFGKSSGISPKNLIDNKHFAVTVPDVKIDVKPDRTDLVETRVIDGLKYILIHAEGNVEVNGVPVKIKK